MSEVGVSIDGKLVGTKGLIHEVKASTYVKRRGFQFNKTSNFYLHSALRFSRSLNHGLLPKCFHLLYL